MWGRKQTEKNSLLFFPSQRKKYIREMHWTVGTWADVGRERLDPLKLGPTKAHSRPPCSSLAKFARGRRRLCVRPAGGVAVARRSGHAPTPNRPRPCCQRKREIVRPARTGSCWCGNTPVLRPCASRCGVGFQAAAACGLPATAKDLVASTSIFLRIASLLVRSLWESRVLSAVLVMAHAFST